MLDDHITEYENSQLTGLPQKLREKAYEEAVSADEAIELVVHLAVRGVLTETFFEYAAHKIFDRISGMKSKNEIIEGYADATELRVVLQGVASGISAAGNVPVIGAVFAALDTYISGKASELYKRRVESLIENISIRITNLDDFKVNREYLESEQFFETFVKGMKVAGESADREKRQLVADYLVGKVGGIVDSGQDDPYSDQVLEDLRILKPFHLQVLKNLNNNSYVDMARPPINLHDMEIPLYQKAVSDLERLGFIQFEDGGGAINSGGGRWRTTNYLKVFKLIVSGQPGSLWNDSPNLNNLFSFGDQDLSKLD